MPYIFNVKLKAIIKALKIVWIGNRNIAYNEISILYQAFYNVNGMTMIDQNESKSDVSLKFEKLMQEWNIHQRQSTRVKPIQLARSLRMPI
jgi:hypothetical protein